MTQGGVEFWRYEHLPAYGKQLIWDWFGRGERGTANPPSESFEPFIYTWFALNAWAACVTNNDQDSEWRRMLAADPDLNNHFDRLQQSDEVFKKSLHHFVSFWPIFEMKSIRPIYPKYRRLRTTENRAELLEDLAQLGIPYEPQGWQLGAEVTWPQLLRTLARVRNNLFHGDKGADDLVDQAIVYAALHVLVHFLRGAHLFTPPPLISNKE